MSRVLLLGVHPPQLLGERKIEAAHYRVWQFLQPLLDDGHTVCLAGDAGDLSGHNGAPSPPIPLEWATGLTHRTVPYGRRGWPATLQAVHDQFAPDCVVAVNFSHCLYATRLKTAVPIWMDIYGDILTIIQAHCYRQQSDRGLATSIDFVRQVLQTGDAFSVCGAPQKHALVGQLAMAGRLNRRSFGYEFAHVVLPAAPPPVDLAARANRRRSGLAPLGIGPDDFVVLWAGGYNTWTDVTTLFRGLELAMGRQPHLHYVSVGANSYEGPDNVYEQFQAMIASSAHRDRFHLLGWRPWPEMAGYYQASDLGINIDALHYETIYGTRTRLVEMIAAGLPVITSLGSELSYLLAEADAAATFQVGDWRLLGEQLATLAGDPDRCRALGEQAHAFAREALSLKETTRPLRQWVRLPQTAPDRVRDGWRSWLQQLEFQSRAALRQALWHVAGLDK